MKIKIPHLIVAGILGTSIASQAAVVYQSDFTGANLGDTGLVSLDGAGTGDWYLNGTDDRAQFDWISRNGRATLHTSDAFQSPLITLDVTFLQQTAGSRYSFGIVDADYTVTGGEGWLTQAMPGAYGIGFSTSGIAGNDVLAFNDGTGVKNNFDSRDELSTAQGNITFNALQTVSFTVTETGWSYSLNGAAATTGLFDGYTFDTSKSYQFIAYLQDTNTTTPGGNMEASYFSNITISVPEPSSTALLGLGGLALMLRRKRS